MSARPFIWACVGLLMAGWFLVLVLFVGGRTGAVRGVLLLLALQVASVTTASFLDDHAGRCRGAEPAQQASTAPGVPGSPTAPRQRLEASATDADAGGETP